MNLWLRLIWLLLTSRRRLPLQLPEGASVLAFRVWPHDLDLSIHMNNGRYLTLMDLGRTDIMLRSGLWREAWRQKWTPIATAISINYRRELRPFQAFRLETRLLCWDATLVIMEQTFVIAGGTRDGEIAARGLFKGGLYDRANRSFVPVSKLMQSIGLAAESPVPAPEVKAFLNANEQLKQSARK